MPLYYVEHRATGEAYKVEAAYAADACEACHWLIGNCFVKLLGEGPYPNVTAHKGLITAPPSPAPGPPEIVKE